MFSRVLSLLLFAAAAALLLPDPALAESSLTLYLGDLWTSDCDVRLMEPGGTDLEFRDVGWTGESFRSPHYYGLRYVHWFRKAPRWGVAGELIHAKMFAQLDETVQVEGLRGGASVSGREPLGDTLQTLSFSHGYNLLLADFQHRWFPGRVRGAGAGRFQPQAGLGIGAAIPHVEVTTAGSSTNEYQVTGPAAQITGGTGIDLSEHLALLVEYKLTWSDIEADLSGGGRLDVSPLAQHLVVGLSVLFGRASPPPSGP